MQKTTIAVISDTHGLLRPKARAVLGSADLIIHAGDIGKAEIVQELAEIAPLYAVRGNVDSGAWADALAETLVLEIGSVRIYVIHNVKALEFDLKQAGYAAVICGHSHMPVNQEKDGVLHFNPGSAGPRRFSLPISMGRITVQGNKLDAELIDLTA